MRPLEGIRVLDLSRLLPGPFLSMVLADMGADVVKVEDPRLGDYLRAIPPTKGALSGRFLAVNRDKRSLALDLKSAAGVDTFLRMVEKADVVIESFRPGVMDRLGVGFAELEKRNPSIILCSISGYGQTGPYRQRAGHDLNYIGTAGVLAMGGERGGAPSMPGVQIADLAGGGLWGATAVLGALVGRERGAKACHLDISMTEGALAMLTAELGNLDCGATPSRGAEALNGALACYQVYKTSDDRYVSVAALEPKFYQAFNKAIGRECNLGEIVGTAEVQESLRREFAAIIATKTRDEWAEIFATADCCCDAILEVDELAEHPLHRERGLFFEMDGGDMGPVLQLRLPVGAAKGERLAPALGEHSAEVLADYGIDS